MRGIVAVLVTLAIAGIVGVGAYDLGVQQGLASTGTAVAPAAYYHPFFWGGFGFFGFLFPLLFIFLIFGLLRAAFGGWGNRYGGGWGRYGYYGPRERLEEIHRELHGEKPKDAGQSGTPPTGR